MVLSLKKLQLASAVAIWNKNTVDFYDIWHLCNSFVYLWKVGQVANFCFLIFFSKKLKKCFSVQSDRDLPRNCIEYGVDACAHCFTGNRPHNFWYPSNGTNSRDNFSKPFLSQRLTEKDVSEGPLNRSC